MPEFMYTVADALGPAGGLIIVIAAAIVAVESIRYLANTPKEGDQ